MTQPFTDDLGVNACLESECRVRMPEIVKTDAADAGELDLALKPIAEQGRMNGGSPVSRENQLAASSQRTTGVASCPFNVNKVLA